MKKSEFKRISSCDITNKLIALGEIYKITQYAKANFNIDLLKSQNLQAYFIDGKIILKKQTKPKEVYKIFNERVFDYIRNAFESNILARSIMINDSNQYRKDEKSFAKKIYDNFDATIKNNPLEREDVIKKFLDKFLEDNKNHQEWNGFSQGFIDSLNKIKEMSYYYFYANNIQHIVYAAKELDCKPSRTKIVMNKISSAITAMLELNGQCPY